MTVWWLLVFSPKQFGDDDFGSDQDDDSEGGDDYDPQQDVSTYIALVLLPWLKIGLFQQLKNAKPPECKTQ